MEERREIEEMQKKIWELRKRAMDGDGDAHHDLMVLWGYIEACCQIMKEADRLRK